MAGDKVTESSQSGNRSRTDVLKSLTRFRQRRIGAIFAFTIPSMVNTHTSHDWLGSFAGRLMQLRPSMHVGTAVQHAVLSIHLAADLDPRRAAELLVSASTAPDAVGDRNAAGPVVAPASRYQAMFGAQASNQTSEGVHA